MRRWWPDRWWLRLLLILAVLYVIANVALVTANVGSTP